MMAHRADVDGTPTPYPDWQTDCRKAARDRARRRLGGMPREQSADAVVDNHPFRSKGKLMRPAEDEVVALPIEKKNT